jgi:hypothetical protein
MTDKILLDQNLIEISDKLDEILKKEVEDMNYQIGLQEILMAYRLEQINYKAYEISSLIDLKLMVNGSRRVDYGGKK